ncbi:hypothetical protein Tco_0796458 [Tanacetum coccineum]
MPFLSTDITSYEYWLWVVSSGSSFVSAVPGQMTYPVASLKLDSASPEGFLSSILLLVVIIVTVLIVAVILVVVVIAIVRVVIVVVFIGIVFVVGGVSSIFKLLFVIIGVLRRIVFYYLLHQPLSYGNGFLQSLRSLRELVYVVDPVPSAGDTEAFETDESAPTPRSPQIRIPFAQTRLRRARKTVRLEPPMSPSMEARIAEYAAAPAPPSPPPSPLSPWSPPLSQIPLPPLPPPPSSLHLPPPVPTSLPLPSSPLPPLPVSLFIPPPVDRREDIPEAELPPRKRLCPTAPTSRYEVGESSTAAPRPTGGHRADYGFIGTTDAEIRRRRAEEVGYGIRDVWVDPTEAVEEVAPTTLEGVNARVTELAAVQEQDTQDVYAVIEDTQDRQTQLFQSVDGLVEDRQFYTMKTWHDY